MPTYNFRDIETGEIEEHLIKLADYDQFLQDNPHLQRIIEGASLSFSGTKSLINRTDNTWKEVLSKIGEQNPHSPLAQQHHRNKSIKRIKSEIIVDKHAKLQRAREAARAKRQ